MHEGKFLLFSQAQAWREEHFRSALKVNLSQTYVSQWSANANTRTLLVPRY